MHSRHGRPYRQLFWLMLFFWLPFLAGPVAAEPPSRLALNEIEGSRALSARIGLLRDASGEIFLDDLLPRADAFQTTSDAQDLHLGYTDDAVWLRLDVTSTADQPRQWLIAFEYPYLERVVFHQVSQAGVVSMVSGATVPPAERPIRHRQTLFPVMLQPGEDATLYFQVRSRGSMTLNLAVWEPQAFHEHDHWVITGISIYLGMLIAFGLYNLLLFVGTRQVAFLYYSLFVLSFATAVLAINGIGPLYLWPGLGQAGSRMLPLGFTLSAAFAMMFTRAFLATARHVPGWHRFLNVAVVVAWVTVLLCLVLPVQLALYQMSILGIATTLVLFTVGVRCVVRGVPGARIFVVAWVMLLAGTSMLALRNLGFLPSNFITLYSIQFGSALEMLLLSLGLASRFNTLKQQREQAQQELVRTLRAHENELERKVAQRTRELADANAKLSLLATRDALTGLANRNGLDDHLQAAMLRTARRGDRLALVMVDLDGFKEINDSHGHESGDEVLREVARRMNLVARGSDFVARFGGDEFVVVAEQIGEEADAIALGERLRRAITEQAYGQAALSLGASIGVSLSDGQTRSVSQLLREADVAMYRRKRAGKGGVTFFGR
ncbi:7TM diverse intracellular signaling domain-containing protein [Pseudomonas sp.]|uniref:7TM diverse intracellular signaling domain-containing protein n=1 Tax=Pseudomonas sp. TaxID=306 RepID=UPI00272C87E3|nr:7TM diverse intracellular signaling domain-containing protein [Pseudomonas sp.]